MSRACRSTPAFAVTDEWLFTVAHPGATMADEMKDQRAGRSAGPPQAGAADSRATRGQRGRRFMRIGCAPPSDVARAARSGYRENASHRHVTRWPDDGSGIDRKAPERGGRIDRC